MSVRRAYILAAVLTAAAGALARADEVRIGKATYYDVTVLGGRDGDVEFLGPAGNTISKPVGEVTFIAADATPALTRAETLADSGDLAGAVAGYESVLADSTGHMATLVRYRLLGALDRLGKINRAVEVWLALLAESSGSRGVIAMRPANLGAKGSAANADAILLLEAASKQASEELRRQAIDGLLLELNTLEGRIGAAEVAARIAAGPEAGASAARQDRSALAEDRLDALAVLVRQGGARDVYAELDKSLRSDAYDVALRPKALLLAAEAQQVMAEGASPDRRRELLIGAGLDAMRVATLFPAAPQAPRALLVAGKVCQGLGNPHAASNALRSVVRDYPSSPAAEDAGKALQQLSRAAPPAGNHKNPSDAEHVGKDTQETR
jgi:tetratricopeptide (TPR) repeat protein